MDGWMEGWRGVAILQARRWAKVAGAQASDCTLCIAPSSGFDRCIDAVTSFSPNLASMCAGSVPSL